MKTIGLVAHNDKKAGMVEFAKKHEAKLPTLSLYCTGTTGSRIEAGTDLKVIKLKSGPLGGDAQLGAMIAEGKLDALLFFIDPLSSQPHDVDVKALTRLAILYDIPFATNLATAEAVLTSVTS